MERVAQRFELVQPQSEQTFGLRLVEIENRHQTKSSLGPIDEAIDYCDPDEMSVYSVVPSTGTAVSRHCTDWYEI